MSASNLELLSSPNTTVPKQVDQEQTEPKPLPPSLDIKPEHLNYLHKGTLVLKQKGDDAKYLLMLEKMIYLTIEYISKNSTRGLKFSPSEEMISYVEQLNKKAADTFKEGKFQESAKVIANVIDLLSQEQTYLMYQTREKLYESKILSYNNLSCVYNAMKKYDLSAKVISSAIKLEEELAAEHYGQSELSIVSTYFNYSAILSQAKQHDKTMEALEKGFMYMAKVANRKGMHEAEKIHIKNLKISGLFMMGKEFEHANELDKAKDSYEKALFIAKELKKQNIIDKVEQALNQLKENKTAAPSS